MGNMMQATGNIEQLVAVRISRVGEEERRRLLDAYRREVYEPAFPIAEIREDVAYWAHLLGHQELPPQPRLEVVLLTTVAGAIVGGATIEHYRTAGCGLLTYIAVAADARGRGIGKRLVREARSALHDMAGAVPMFAETERYLDAEDDAERAETIVRQRQLAKLGARMLTFDYVMPPLRPDTSPHPLHLLLFASDAEGTHAAVPATQVAALVRELAQALGGDIDAHQQTHAMMVHLAELEEIALEPLPATRFDRQFVETPVFDGLTTATFSFAFELGFRKAADVERAAIRVERIQAALEAGEGHADVHSSLVEPVRSFLDDVTTGPPGRNGRPLLVVASAAASTAAERAVTLVRPPAWQYRAEGQCTELTTAPGAERQVEMRLHDAVCAFESGRIFYILSLALPETGAALDEYAVLQLEQLALRPHQLADRPDYLCFDWQGARHSLLGFANARMAALAAGPADELNAVNQILRPFEMIRPGERRMEFAAEDVRGLCIGIESETLLDVAMRAKAKFEDGADAPESSHDGFGRELLAFAGMVQGVEDFPFQDESELHDSTRPTSHSVESAIYAHPRFLIEIAKGWRSYHMARPGLGNCPYLLMTWLVALHDEIIVSRIEARIDEMIYSPQDRGYRSVPLADLDKVLRRARNISAATGNDLVEANLQRRLDLFRWLSINRSGNVFRYAKEREALAAVQAAMGTEGRFERATQTVDRIETLVEDASALRSSYADRRTNAMLFMIAVLSVFSVSNDVQEHFSVGTIDIKFFAIVAVLLTAVGLMLFRDRHR